MIIALTPQPITALYACVCVQWGSVLPKTRLDVAEVGDVSTAIIEGCIAAFARPPLYSAWLGAAPDNPIMSSVGSPGQLPEHRASAENLWCFRPR